MIIAISESIEFFFEFMRVSALSEVQVAVLMFIEALRKLMDVAWLVLGMECECVVFRIISSGLTYRSLMHLLELLLHTQCIVYAIAHSVFFIRRDVVESFTSKELMAATNMLLVKITFVTLEVIVDINHRGLYHLISIEQTLLSSQVSSSLWTLLDFATIDYNGNGLL